MEGERVTHRSRRPARDRTLKIFLTVPSRSSQSIHRLIETWQLYRVVSISSGGNGL
jgi:hypothetical protein